MGGPRIGTPSSPLRLAVLISGGGSGMQALLDYESKIASPCFTTCVVVSDRKGAGGLSITAEYGIAAEVVSLEDITVDAIPSRRRAHEMALQLVLERYEVEGIILSGYMRILTANFLQDWSGRVLNIHPSLLPRHPGAHAHHDVLTSGDTVSGCTVHFVDSGMDTGAIIAQSEVPVHRDDTIEMLQERVKVVEHHLYPNVIADFAAGRFRLEGETVIWENLHDD
ncbi:MAG TPA: phosphoribosylglycinamide formyltransferase [Candidatus Thalassarchaeaceae archaeon]|nr:phosphoribosylglycinamide formyltransferase [Candidatus Thalassarchaeaceae archaeon]